MELPLFEQVADVIRTLTPGELGELRLRAHRRGVKVWFDTAKAPKEHYEAQLLARRHVDGRDGMALEIGFHAEHSDVDANTAIIDHLLASEATWREVVGADAEVGEFLGASNWRRVSETWLEPELEDPDLPFDIGSRVVDYLEAIEAARRT